MEWGLDPADLLQQEGVVNDTSALDWKETWPLPTCLLCSSIGMILFKMSQTRNSVSILVAGYTLEAVAFVAYPFALSKLPMRVVCTAWAASSTVTSLLGGWLFYSEEPSHVSALGCAVVVFGVFLATR